MLTDWSDEVRLPSRRAAVADDRRRRGGAPPLVPVRRGTDVVHAPGWACPHVVCGLYVLR